MMKFVILALAFAAIVVLTTACQPQQEELWNVYSAQCDRGQYAIYPNTSGEGQFVCEESWKCQTDSDCTRLLVEKLPPRVGVCENGMCAAACGSGMIRPCR